MAHKILIIEDEDKIRKVLELHLKAAGFETATAANGFEALRDVEKINPDLVISDIMMPKLTGLEFSEALKHKSGTKNIPIIVISALSDRDTVMKAKELGAAKFLAKPFKVKALLEAVRKVLNIDQPATPNA